MSVMLKPYLQYQETGHDWLGVVPSHWKVLPNRAIFQEVKDQNHPDEPLLSVTISRGVLPQDDLLANSSKKDSSNLDKSKYKLVQPGDIAYNKMRAWQGALGVSQHRGLVSPAYVVVRPRQKQAARYFHYLLRTPSFIKEAERWSYGITSDMWSLRYEDFKLIYCVLPPLPEQRQIAYFLDRQSKRVHQLIRARQRLIALLNEQKQVIIQRAVTRGLDPDVPLKPSGVDWLGEVPEHWDVVQLRRITQHGRQVTYGIVQPGEPDPSGRYMIRGQDYSFGWCTPDSIFRVSESIERAYSRSRLMPGDIVITIVGAVGNVAVVPDWLEGANITQTTARISIDPGRASSEFVALVLQGPVGQRNVERYVYGAAQPRLNLPHVSAFLVPLPPVTEQREITQATTKEVSSLEEAIEQTRREIDLIREYHTRLIADVVTGKLDVRGVALPATGDPVDAEDWDDAETEAFTDIEEAAYADE